MADPFSIIKEFVEFGFKINSALETDGDNAEGCRRIDDLLGRVRAIPKQLQGSPNMVEGLRQALERASEFVANYKGKPFVSRAFNAGGIAEKLRRVCEDVLLNMNAVQLNMMAELRADVTHNKKNVDKILLIVTKQQEEKAKLVKDYQISSQTKNERATKKTGVASISTLRRRLNGGGDARAHLAPSASFPHVLRGARRAVRERRRSVGVSAAPFHPQKIISTSEEPGETGRYKISPHSSKTSKQERAQDLKIISRSIENMTSVTSIDAHPTKTWILTGHKGGNFSIWDYQKQKTVELQVNEVPDKAELKWHEWGQYVKEKPLKHPVFSAKFIGKGKRLVVGDGHGYIYVYDYIDTKLHKVKKFKAHNKSVNSLAAHPTEPYLLSSSAFSNNIKVWDWSNDWKQIRNIYVKPEVTYYTGVLSVKFNPRDTDTFACVTDDKSVKVWNPKTSSLETKLKGPYVEADYFFTRSQQHLMVTLRSDSHNSEIRDLKTGEVVHTLSVSGRKTTQVACHPKLPILVTTLDDGTVCLWDASTYRLEKMVHITDSECRDLVFLPDTNGLPRLAVAFEKMIAIMEVNLPIASTSNASG